MDMSFSRVAKVLAVLAALCACNDREESGGPLLPIISLPTTTVGLDYELHLTATGGVPPLRYSVREVPPGFSFYSDTARLTGPATAEGQYTLNIGVTDAQGSQDSRAYTLRVYAALAVTTASLPGATSGVSYELLLGVQGGQPPLRWTLADGSLPPGMTLSTDGNLSGVPRGLGGYPFTVRVQDANGALATRLLTLEVEGEGTDGGVPDGGSGPDGGVSFPLHVGNWNIEFFGDTSGGPTNESLQLSNVSAVLADAGVDFWSLQEIVDVNAFNTLKAELSGYDGFVANDARVASGSSYYSTFEQKLAVLYRSDAVSVQSARIILGNMRFDFADRPPLRVDLRLTRNGATVDMVAIVLHMKAEANLDDYNRRQAAAVALKQYLDTELPTARVIVLGDWNDDVDTSIVSGQPTPYQNFLDAPASYTFLTQTLSQSTGSTVSFPSFIDHQLVSNELAQHHVPNSTRVLRPAIPSYGSTTSDHYPILSRFDFGEVSSTAQVIINEVLPHEPPDGSGGRDYAQQFVEIVNVSSEAVDVSGWKVHDVTSSEGTTEARHVFGPGTLLDPGKALVVFSGASAIPPGATHAVAASSGGLFLNKSTSGGDTVILLDSADQLIDRFQYVSTVEAVSYNRDPDATPEADFVLHTTLPSGLSASPGKRGDGTDF